MKKIFILQAVTGEEIKESQREMKKTYGALLKAGYSAYSTLEDEDKIKFKKAGDWVFHAFDKINKCDYCVAIIKSERKSEGVLMEIGYVLARKIPLVLAIKVEVKNTYLRDMAKKVIEWKNFEDLIKKLEKLKI